MNNLITISDKAAQQIKKIISFEYDLLSNITNKKVYYFETDEQFFDIGTPDNYLNTDRYFTLNNIFE